MRSNLTHALVPLEDKPGAGGTGTLRTYRPLPIGCSTETRRLLFAGDRTICPGAGPRGRNPRMIGETARQRTARRARLLVTVLLAGAAAALLGGSPAHAAGMCDYDSGTDEVTITFTGDRKSTRLNSSH